MIRIFLISFFVLATSFAEDFDERLPLANSEGGPNIIVKGCVNVITGEFVDSEVHFVLPGPEPLIYESFYTNSMCWRNNHRCSASFKCKDKKKDYENKCFYCHPGQLCSNLISKFKTNNEILKVDFSLDENKGITNIGRRLVSGQTNHKNLKMTLPNHWNNTISMKLGDGTINRLNKIKGNDYWSKYLLSAVEKINGNGLIYNTKYVEFIGDQVNTKIQALSHKNSQVFSEINIHYDQIPDKRETHTITSNDGRVLKKIYKPNFCDIRIAPNKYLRKVAWNLAEVKNPNSPDVKYTHWYNSQNIPYLVKKECPNDRNVVVKYIGHDKKVTGLPDGKKLRRHDDRRNRVYTVKSPVNRSNIYQPLCNLEYSINKSGGGNTIVYDALKHRTAYCYDDKKRLCLKQDFLGTSHYRKYRLHVFSWGDEGNNQGNLRSESLVDINHFQGFTRYYEYDQAGNVKKEKLKGDFIGTDEYTVVEGKGHKRKKFQWIEKNYEYSKDGLNLLVKEEDLDKVTEYAYIPGTNLMKSKIVSANGAILLREFYEYDEYAINTLKIVDDGCSYKPEDKNGVTQRLITKIIPKYSMPVFGVPEEVIESYWDPSSNEIKQLKRTVYTYSKEGWVTQEDIYDADDVFCYSLTKKYNQYGQVKEENDPMGHITFKNYDENGNQKREEGPRPGYVKKFTYDYRNRPIKTIEFDNGKIFASSSVAYDLEGNIINEIDQYGNETHRTYDALGRELTTKQPAVKTLNGDFENPVITKDYDIFDNPCRVEDAEGRCTESRFTVHQKPYNVTFADGTEEIYEYNLNGTLKKQVARNGVTTRYEYDPLGREVLKEVMSQDGVVFETNQSHYEGLSLRYQVDTAGMITEFEYDGAGRKTAIKQGERLTTFEYDTLGRESIVKQWLSDEEFIAKIKVYDFCDQVIEERVENHLGEIQTCAQYHYDETGNQIRVIEHFNGHIAITETEYDCHKRPLRVTDSAGKVTAIEYLTINRSGQKVLQRITTDPAGIQQIETHDALNRVVSLEKKDPFGTLLSKQEVVYDKIGNRVKTETTVITPDEEDRVITTLWEYNSENQVICLIEAARTNEQRISRFEYTCFGERELVTKPDGVQLKYTYNDFGLVDTVQSDSSKHPVSYAYLYDNRKNLIEVVDKINQLVTERRYNNYNELIYEKLGNGLEIAYEKDLIGRNIAVLFPQGNRAEYRYSGAMMHQVSWKTYTHTYDHFDLSGRLCQATMIGQAGQLHLEYDSKGREVVRESPHWSHQVIYNNAGNLTYRNLTDNWGNNECRYSYDKLNQLTEEKGIAHHTYTHDSINNRVCYDGDPLTLNDLNQVIHYQGQTYTYDPSGNLISDSSADYEYDAFNRLIAVHKDGDKTQYIYDAFNRRIIKNQNESQTRFVYQGDREVGAVGQDTEEYRILGLGLGAEIGAAVLIELNGKIYAPVHDQVGNLVQLIDADTGRSAASYRLSSFGKIEKHEGISSPWVFSSKRLDLETGWTYFGRRYYSTELGRWTTCDPKGYSEGPNLYAYVYNNPLMLFDLFGLAAYAKQSWGTNDMYALKMTRVPRTGNMPLFRTYTLGSRIPTGRQYIDWDNLCDRKNYSNVFTVGDEEEDGISKFIVNGMRNTYDDCVNWANEVSKMLDGVSITGIYNATHGFLTDLFECIQGFIFKVATNPAKLMAANIYQAYLNNPDGNIMLFCHSQGTIHVARALELLDKEIRDKIHIIAVGPSEYINPEMCGSVLHLVCRNDGVSMIDIWGRNKYRDTIKFLDRHPDDGLWVHSVESNTYRTAIKEYGPEILENLKR